MDGDKYCRGGELRNKKCVVVIGVVGLNEHRTVKRNFTQKKTKKGKNGNKSQGNYELMGLEGHKSGSSISISGRVSERSLKNPTENKILLPVRGLES